MAYTFGMGIAKAKPDGGKGMPLAQITRPGLAAIAVSVALLWGCLAGEHVLMRKALGERARVLRRLVPAPPRTQPVAAPAPFVHRRLRPTEG